MSDWISVNDRLPANREFIDVWHSAERDPINNKYDFRIADMHFNQGNFYITKIGAEGDYHYHEVLKDITHWMPLPEPPESKK